MLMSRWRLRAAGNEDRELAARLAGEALFEIRSLAVRAGRHPDEGPAAEVVDEIDAWAKFCTELLAASGTRRRRRLGDLCSPRERALTERPMSHVWNVSGPERRAWILRQVDRSGLGWTPPPSL
ncbi:hypothetical protein [Kitasatospora sp. NPDC051705]|uniref:hypothetical protein n=1 Tax=Kitasatospora sp. NPDC051705 TaxID=3364057 RepID=UPI0037A6EA00